MCAEPSQAFFSRFGAPSGSFEPFRPSPKASGSSRACSGSLESPQPHSGRYSVRSVRSPSSSVPSIDS
eukprot:9929940-Alexandrium_andersonii.AAC.1